MVFLGNVEEGAASDQYAAVFHGQTINRINFRKRLGGDDFIDNNTQHHAVIDGGAEHPARRIGRRPLPRPRRPRPLQQPRPGANTLDYANHDEGITRI